MANIKSAKKRVLVNKRQKAENRLVKAALSTEVKKFRKALEAGDIATAEARLVEVESSIMAAKSKNVLHANTASRKVSRLKAALDKAKSATVETKVEEVKAEEAVEVEAEAEKIEE